MAVSYVTWNRSRQRWQYARGVPKNLRPLYGDKLHFKRHWLRDAPRANTPSAERAALSEAEKFKLRDDLLIQQLDSLTSEERTYALKNGGLRGLASFVQDVAPVIALTEGPGVTLADPEMVARVTKRPLGDIALEQLRGQKVMAALRSQVERAGAIVLKAIPDNEFSFVGLRAIWVKSQGPYWNGRQDDHARTARLLREVLGNVDYRDVTQEDHAVRFRDALESRGGYTWQKGHLERASGMYGGAVSEGKMRGKPNPFSGVSVRGHAADADEDQTDLFTPEQLKALLAKSREIRFGDTRREKRHVEAQWLFEVMTYSGMRPNEVLQLQRGDVYIEPDSGVKVLHIRRTCCVTGKRHGEKSMKNPKLRDVYVPLHPKLKGFVDFASAGDDKAEFIFASFPYKGVAKKRRGWFDTNFGKLMDACRIKPKPGKKLSLYSIRRAFHRAMDDAGISEKRQRVITSHAPQDVHDGYSRGAELKALARDVARVDPLA